MAGRYAEHRTIDGCLSPITVFHHGVKYIVPCGKCSACLVNRSNSWNWRLSDEIDTVKYSIFFTLTYDNKYVPRLFLNRGYCNFLGGSVIERDCTDIRFDGKKDVQRKDDLDIIGSVFNGSYPMIRNFVSTDKPHLSDRYFAYSSKRDVQLWLKLLRKDIDLNFSDYEEKKKRFRYYIISEYGPLTFRPHVHGIIFCESQEIADFLVQCSLYQNWQMCDKTLFDQYTHFCDSGASGYLSGYLTCFNSLPKILQSKCIRPFRLSSKSPSVGFSRFDKKEVIENVSIGNLEYTKQIPRIDTSYVFRYSSRYLSTLFPKCFEYSILPYNRLLQVYGNLYTSVVEKGEQFDVCSSRLRKNLRSIDYIAAKRCYEFCIEYYTVPAHYLYVMDMCLYASNMFSLKNWYEWQEKSSSLEILFSYVNVGDYKNRYFQMFDYQRFVFRTFLEGFGVDVLDFVKKEVYDSYKVSCDSRQLYEAELNDICTNMVKTKILNETLGCAPTNFV